MFYCLAQHKHIKICVHLVLQGLDSYSLWKNDVQISTVIFTPYVYTFVLFGSIKSLCKLYIHNKINVRGCFPLQPGMGVCNVQYDSLQFEYIPRLLCESVE